MMAGREDGDRLRRPCAERPRGGSAERGCLVPVAHRATRTRHPLLLAVEDHGHRDLVEDRCRRAVVAAPPAAAYSATTPPRPGEPSCTWASGTPAARSASHVR